MALGECRECGHRVSTEAATCPSCGVANPAGTQRGKAAAKQQKTGAGTVATGVFGGILGCVVAPFILGLVLLIVLYIIVYYT